MGKVHWKNVYTGMTGKMDDKTWERIKNNPNVRGKLRITNRDSPEPRRLTDEERKSGKTTGKIKTPEAIKTPPEAKDFDFENKTVPELDSYIDEMGLDVDKGLNKPEKIESIKEKLKEN